MSPNSEIPSAKDTTIQDAITASSAPIVQTAPVVDEVAKAELTEKERLEREANYRKVLALRQFQAMMKRRDNLYNTPFDGSKRAAKKAKNKASRKANKKRKLYVRYGK